MRCDPVNVMSTMPAHGSGPTSDQETHLPANVLRQALFVWSKLLRVSRAGDF